MRTLVVWLQLRAWQIGRAILGLPLFVLDVILLFPGILWDIVAADIQGPRIDLFRYHASKAFQRSWEEAKSIADEQGEETPNTLLRPASEVRRAS